MARATCAPTSGRTLPGQTAAMAKPARALQTARPSVRPTRRRRRRDLPQPATASASGLATASGSLGGPGNHGGCGSPGASRTVLAGPGIIIIMVLLCGAVPVANSVVSETDAVRRANEFDLVRLDGVNPRAEAVRGLRFAAADRDGHREQAPVADVESVRVGDAALPNGPVRVVEEAGATSPTDGGFGFAVQHTAVLEKKSEVIANWTLAEELDGWLIDQALPAGDGVLVFAGTPRATQSGRPVVPGYNVSFHHWPVVSNISWTSIISMPWCKTPVPTGRRVAALPVEMPPAQASGNNASNSSSVGSPQVLQLTVALSCDWDPDSGVVAAGVVSTFQFTEDGPLESEDGFWKPVHSERGLTVPSIEAKAPGLPNGLVATASWKRKLPALMDTQIYAFVTATDMVEVKDCRLNSGTCSDDDDFVSVPRAGTAWRFLTLPSQPPTGTSLSPDEIDSASVAAAPEVLGYPGYCWTSTFHAFAHTPAGPIALFDVAPKSFMPYSQAVYRSQFQERQDRKSCYPEPAGTHLISVNVTTGAVKATLQLNNFAAVAVDGAHNIAYVVDARFGAVKYPALLSVDLAGDSSNMTVNWAMQLTDGDWGGCAPLFDRPAEQSLPDGAKVHFNLFYRGYMLVVSSDASSVHLVCPHPDIPDTTASQSSGCSLHCHEAYKVQSLAVALTVDVAPNDLTLKGTIGMRQTFVGKRRDRPHTISRPPFALGGYVPQPVVEFIDATDTIMLRLDAYDKGDVYSDLMAFSLDRTKAKKKADWSMAVNGLGTGAIVGPDGNVGVLMTAALASVGIPSASEKHTHEGGIQSAAVVIVLLKSGIMFARSFFKPRASSSGQYKSEDDERSNVCAYRMATIVGLTMSVAAFAVAWTSQHHAESASATWKSYLKAQALVSTIADVPSFKSSYLQQDQTCSANNISTTPTQEELHSLCFCTGTYWPEPALCLGGSDKCSGANYPSCDAVYSSHCLCDQAFDNFTCSFSINPDGSYNVSYASHPTLPNGVIAESVKQCGGHYSRIVGWLFASLMLHAIGEVVSMLIKLMQACCASDTSALATLALGRSAWSGFSMFVGGLLWLVPLAMYLKGPVCTTDGTESVALLRQGVPGCQWQSYQDWYSREREVLTAISAALFVHLMEPVHKLLDSCAGCIEMIDETI